MIFIDGDFKSNKGDCKYHCSPTCHPGQTGPDWKYGCTHKAWPPNRYGDFVPLVECDGLISKCDLKETKFISHYLRGLKVRQKNAEKKSMKLLNEIKIIENNLIK